MESLDGIAVYVKVVQSGSFTQAAKLLRMPKTTVSAKVASLERRLGTTLIHRTTRKLHVTEAGMAYFKRCLRALEEVEAGEQELLQGSATPQGTLRITAPVDVGQSILPRILRSYFDKYPEMTVDLLITNRVVDLVSEGVDLAIRAGELKDSSLIAKKFIAFQNAFWASPQFAKSKKAPDHPKNIVRSQLVSHSMFRNRKVEMTDGKSRTSMEFDAHAWADDFQTIKAMLNEGCGIAWMPVFVCEKEEDKGRLVRVLPRWQSTAPTHFSFVYPEQKFVSTKVRAFLDVTAALKF